MTRPMLRSVLPWLCLALAGFLPTSAGQDADAPASQEEPRPGADWVQYLEIVTPEVEATCAMYEELHGLTFGEPEAPYGNARIAERADGGRIGVRAPMHAAEEPVVRAYLLVDDIGDAVEAAVEAGGELAVPPMEIQGRGRFAIFFQGGVQHALWQL